jgi:enamine deaminase RidA (YjgF/YER057c/UK114 family)
VVATNVHLDNIDDFARMNRIYGQSFPAVPPARTTLAQVAPVARTPRNDDTHPPSNRFR